MDAGSDAVYSASVNSGLAGGSYQSFTNWLTFPFDKDVSDVYTAATGRALGVRA